MFNVCPGCGLYLVEKEMVRFNRWLRENAETTTQPLTLLDTTEPTIEATVSLVAQWVRERNR